MSYSWAKNSQFAADSAMFGIKNKLPNAAVIDGILIELTVVLPSEHHHGICREREFRGEFKICFGSENKALLEPVFSKMSDFFNAL